MLQTTEARGAGLPPGVLSRSEGWPHDGEAFRSGWHLGELAATLGRPGVSALAQSIRPLERRQAELIASSLGYTMTVEPGGDADWVAVTFRRIHGPG